MPGRHFTALNSKELSPFSDEDDYHGGFDDDYEQDGDDSHVASGRATDHRCITDSSNKTVGDISFSAEDTAIVNEDDADDNISDDEAEPESDDDDSDEYHVALKQMTGRGRTTDPLTYTLVKISRLANGMAIIAAFRDYSVHDHPESVPLVSFIDIQTPAEYESLLLDPSRSDARVRAYFRRILEKSEMEARQPKSNDEYASKAAQLLEGLVQREMSQFTPTGWLADSRLVGLPIFQYALAKAYLASDRVEDGLIQLQKILSGAAKTASASVGGDHDVLRNACQRLVVHAWQRTRGLHKAVPLLEEMVSEQISKYGKVHCSVFELQNALAAAYEANQQAPKAISLLEDMLKFHDHPHHQSQLTALHLLLRSETMAGKRSEAELTIAHISDVIKRSVLPLSPLQAISSSAITPVAAAQHGHGDDSQGNPRKAPHPARNAMDFSNSTSSLQRLVDHMIDSQPDDDTLPPDLSDRVVAYKKHAKTTRQLQFPSAPTSPPAAPSTKGLDTARSSGMLSIQSTSATPVVAVTSKMIDIAAVASTPAPVAIGAAAVGVSGAIGMAAASLYRLFYIEVPKLKLEEEAGRIEKAKAYADMQTGFEKRLGIIKGLALLEEEAARESGGFEKLKECKEKTEQEVRELQEHILIVEQQRKADLQQERDFNQQSKKKSAAIQWRQAKEIERLKEQLRISNANSSGTVEKQEECSRVSHQKSGCEGARSTQRANSQPQAQDAPHEMDFLESTDARTRRQWNTQPVTEGAPVPEASNARLQTDFEITVAKAESQQSEIDSLKEQLTETQHERDELQLARSVQAATCRSDDLPATENCQNCAESRSMISVLRADLKGEDFGGHETNFVDSLDPSRDVSELVQILSGRLKSFIQALYWDLIPLDTRQKADIDNARADAKDLQARLKDAETSISDLRGRLAKSSGKASRLEQSLTEARAEQTKVLVGTAERVNSASHEAADQQAGPWWRSMWSPPRRS
jgi:hypothetical protein